AWLVDRYKSHSPRVVELSHGGNEGVAEFLDLAEESKTQIIGRDLGKERSVQALILWANGAHEHRGAIRQMTRPFPFLWIRPDGEARMAAERAAGFFKGRDRDACIDGNDPGVVAQQRVEVYFPDFGHVGHQ